MFSVSGLMTKAVIWRALMQSVCDVCRRCDVWSEYRPKHVAGNTANKTDHRYQNELVGCVYVKAVPLQAWTGPEGS